MKISVKRTWSCDYRILEVETIEGGCNQTELRGRYESIPEAIIALESVVDAPNCDYYIVVSYSEDER